MTIADIKARISPLKKKNICILIAAILVIAVAIVVTLLVLNRNKNVKDLYFRIETRNFVNFMNEIEKRQNDNIAKTKPFREQPSRTRYEISAKLSQPDNKNGNNSFGDLPAQAVDVINSSKLVLNSWYDLKNDKKTGSLSFLLEGQSFLDINAFWDKDIMGIQVPVIYDKYFVFNKNNISNALNKFGIDIPVKKILTISDIKDTVNFSTGEFRDILIDYIKFLEENITDQQVSMSRNVKITSQPGATPGKFDIFTVKLNESQFKAIATKTVDMLCTDKRLLNITLGKVYSVLDMLKGAGYFDLVKDMESTVGQLQKYEDTEKLRQDLLDIIENTSFPEGFEMFLAVDKSGNMVNRKISFASKAEGESKRMFNLNAGQFFTNLVIEQEAGSNPAENARIEIETVRQDGTGGRFLHINCINNIWPDFEVLINTRKEMIEDNKKKAINTSYSLDINLTCKSLNIENGNILVDIKREDRYGVDFELPDINEATAIDINSIDEEGIKAVQTEIQFTAAKFLLTNQYLINAFTQED
ncbi:MAG: hypothetical protein HPY74_05760 [Firmicutes bacterium]|nr:hypothetical protein [Bacillota bacterium]